MSYTDDQLAALTRTFTPQQRANLDILDRAPWRWFVSDRYYFSLVDRYAKEAQGRYWATLSRVTTYQGEDYRIQHTGQKTWIRATRLQYEQAGEVGVERSIGVPESRLLQIAA